MAGKILSHLFLACYDCGQRWNWCLLVGPEVHMRLTKRHYLMMGASTVLAAALTVSAATLRDGSDPVTVPEHTAIHVTLDQALATNQSRPGDTFAEPDPRPV